MGEKKKGVKRKGKSKRGVKSLDVAPVPGAAATTNAKAGPGKAPAQELLPLSLSEFIWEKVSRPEPCQLGTVIQHMQVSSGTVHPLTPFLSPCDVSVLLLLKRKPA